MLNIALMAIAAMSEFVAISDSTRTSNLQPCPSTEQLVSEMVRQYKGTPNAEQIKDTMKKRMTNCYGSSEFINGIEYVGEWKDGTMHGKGIATDANKNKYTGEFKDGLKSGYGLIVFSNGSSYAGDWKEGEPQGQGTFISNNGNKYEGGFNGSHWSGLGTLTLANKSKITGLWYRSNFVPDICETSGIPASSPEHKQCILRYMDKIDNED